MSATTEQTNYYQDMLREQGYVSLPFGLGGTAIDPIFAQFRDVSDETRAPGGENIVKALHYSLEGRPKDGDYFMERRRVGETNSQQTGAPATDDKDFLHYGPQSIKRAQAVLGKHLPGSLKVLLDSCAELHDATKTAVRPVFRALGMEDIMLAREAENDVHIVRVIRYLGTEATHKADIHFDRSVATFAAWESSSGLVGAPGNNAYAFENMGTAELAAIETQVNASPINHQSGEGKFFLGAAYNHLPAQVRASNGYVPLLAHGVVNKASDEERDAVVVFMNPHLGVQDHTVPGKNETGFSDLAQFLKKRRGH